ncbi:MAG: S8 family serine peptidase [Bacteroidota bacterium]
MNKFLLLLIIGACFSDLRGQTVFKDYTDGMLYVKLSKASARTISVTNPRNIPLAELKIFASLLTKYNVTKAYLPFYQAKDDQNLPYTYKLEFKKITGVNAFIEELSAIKGVEYAERVPLMKTDITPNDPTFPAQLTQINAQNAWNVFNGSSNITVAIVDNAVMWTHQDLVANTYTNAGEIAGNSIDDDANGYVDDVNGWDVADWDNNAIPTQTLMDHGTHCAGIAGARTNNGIGIASIGWNIKLIPVKTTYDTGNTSTISDGYGGIIYAARAGARVVSCSWGGGGFAQSEQNVVNYAWNKGCLVVAAAGNSSSSIQSYPGAYGNVFCVASIGSGDVKSGFSNFGTWVDISAPGEGHYSTIPNSTTGTYGFKSGTSMATPMVAGLAALMLSNCSTMTQTDVINCISSTAVNIYTLSGNATYSTSSQLGAGRIDAFAAMNCASVYLTVPPIANFYAFPLNTCPNTPVTFYDSSLYTPLATTRSWTFQSGTPSTAANFTNVLVQWSTAGTYSAALTVSNTFGSSTKNKLAYVTVAGPIALPLVEGFQQPAFLPVNWTQNNIFNDAIYWNRVTGIGGFGTSTACAVFDNYNIDAAYERDEMRTPKYIFSNVASARLRFDVAYARYNAFFSDTLEVKLSTNCGATWTSIYLKGGSVLSTRSDLSANTFTPTNAQWRTDSIDITMLTAGQGNVMFSFINRGHYGQALYLDNINLAFPTPTLNAAIPASVCVGATFNSTNTSVGAATYTWNFPGGSPASSNATAPGASYPSAGLYTVTLIGLNGTTTTSATRTINIIALPVVSVNTPTICDGSVTTLTASGTSNYTWTGFPAGPNLSVSPPITTVYTVTGSNGVCSAVKNATVFVNPNPTLTVNSPTICSGLAAILSPTGATSYTWTDGTTVSTTPFLVIVPPTTAVYTLTGSNGNCSSQITGTVLVNPTPTLSAVNPTICSGSAVTLSVNGANSYLWNTGPATNTLSVTPAQTNNYTVTGTSLGCSSSKTITVNVQATPSVSVSGTQLLICASGVATLTATGANTFSWSNSLTAPTITVNPTLTTAYMVTGTNTLCSNSSQITVTVIAAPAIVVSTSPASSSICSGASATLNVSGPYNNFTWAGPGAPVSSTVVSPTSSSVYTVSASSANGCNTSSLVNLVVNSNPFSTISFTNASCNNSCSGIANALSSSGTSPYTYTLNGGNCNSLPCSNLCVGAYTLQTSDAAGCNSTANFSITAPVNSLSLSVVTTSASCSSCPSGSGSVNVSGGLAPYNYTWTPNGGNAATSSGLLPGCYTISVNDANLCLSQTSLCIGIWNTIGIDKTQPGINLLLIYPNPTQNFVTVEYNGFVFDYSIYNNLGQLVREKSNNQNKAVVRLEDLAKGVYIIEIRNGSERANRKLVIE